MNDRQAEQLGNTWLKNNGITLKQFNQADIWQLQAQKTAHDLLKHKAHLLKDAQLVTLMAFCQRMLVSTQRQKITKRMTYEVLNISKQVKRQQFKANKRR